MQFGAHGTTFGGNPLAAAVARVALRELSSPAAAGQRASASRRRCAMGWRRSMPSSSVFAEVRGRGLMLGAVLRSAYAGRAGEILDHAARAWPAAAAGRSRCAAVRAGAEHQRRRYCRRLARLRAALRRSRRADGVAAGAEQQSAEERDDVRGLVASGLRQFRAGVASNASRAASIVSAISASSCAVDMKPASNADGARYTPRSSMAWKKRLNAAMSQAVRLRVGLHLLRA